MIYIVGIFIILGNDISECENWRDDLLEMVLNTDLNYASDISYTQFKEWSKTLPGTTSSQISLYLGNVTRYGSNQEKEAMGFKERVATALSDLRSEKKRCISKKMKSDRQYVIDHYLDYVKRIKRDLQLQFEEP